MFNINIYDKSENIPCGSIFNSFPLQYGKRCLVTLPGSICAYSLSADLWDFDTIISTLIGSLCYY